MANVENQPSQQLTDELIAIRAYAKWQERGCPTGEQDEDWFAARADLERELSEATKSNGQPAKA